MKAILGGQTPTTLTCMDRSFSTRVADPAWQREVVAWLEATLVDVEITGVTQPRIRPWSTQLQLTTSDGPLWFKAGCSAQSFEPGLLRELADLAPDSFDSPVAWDAARGWMVTADRGATWGDQAEPGLDDWRSLAVEAARVQQQLTRHSERLIGAGLPDCSPQTVVDRFDRLVTLLAELPADDPAHLAPDIRSELLERRPMLVDAVDTLMASTLPITWQHGDLHPWNVFVVDGRPRLFDLGDAQWAHALEILAVPYGWIAERTDLEWRPIFEAYSGAWDLTAADLAADWDAAQLTQAVNRAMTWWSCLDEATADEWAEWGEAPLFHLTRVLN